MIEYGSESLTELNLGSFNSKLWPSPMVAFKRVEKLKITIETDSDGIKLNQVCPKLRELRVCLKKKADYDFIDCEVPHLEQLEMTFGSIFAWNQKEQIISFIKKNPQIRSVIADPTVPEFTKMISEHLINIENVTISFKDDLNGPVHFENVKHCALRLSYTPAITNLSFSHLESLEIEFVRGHIDIYSEFFRRNKNLTRLSVKLFWNTVLDLEEFTAELPNLTKLVLGGFTGVAIETVTRFIESRPKLIEIEFPVYEVFELELEELRRRFRTDWHIKSSIKRGVFLMAKKTQM